MLLLAFRNLVRRPLRSLLTTVGLAVAVAVLGCLSAFGDGYRSSLHTELDRMGMQMMLVPLGCPYDAAARALKGRTLEVSLPAASAGQASRDPAVAVAAPVLLAAVPRLDQGRTDMWAGIDEASVLLKPWWRMRSGKPWFEGDDSVILGADAAEVEMRAPGDRLYSPETGKTFRVAGILQRSGTSDDSLFFVPLRTAQLMFHQPDRITAVSMRLKDPSLVSGAATRLQTIPGAQVVTLTEMMGTFLNLVGAVRALLLAIATVAVVASSLTVFNTLLAAVLEQSRELAVMRALGASRSQLFGLVTLQAVLLTGIGSAAGILLAVVAGHGFEVLVRQFVPFPPAHSLLAYGPSMLAQCVLVGVGVGLCSGLYPAWQASRLRPAEAMKAL